MAADSEESARVAAIEFSRGVAQYWKLALRDDLIGFYLLGSLAHGGFNRRYSDIDLALISEHPVEPDEIARMKVAAVAISEELAAKTSLFFTDRSFSTGRFPPLDRVDYLDHARPLIERERINPKRPVLDDIRDYLKGAPFSTWEASVRHLVALETLSPEQRKPLLRALLYPARWIYGWKTGCMGSNDAAVAYVHEHEISGLDLTSIERAMQCRSAAADPDPLFVFRSVLPRQVEACVRLISG